jgi:hypothetical protein
MSMASNATNLCYTLSSKPAKTGPTLECDQGSHYYDLDTPELDSCPETVAAVTCDIGLIENRSPIE